MNHEQSDLMKAALAAGKLPTPGLKWRKRSSGMVPYWEVGDGAADYPVRSANLDHMTDPLLLSARCVRLQEELLKFKRGGLSGPAPRFNGAFGGAIDVYLSDPESTYAKLKGDNPRVYLIYARKLKAHIGEKRIDDIDGLDVKRWFKVWADQEDHNNPHSPYRKLGAGRMTWCVLRAAVSHGVICRQADCAALDPILSKLTFPVLKPRTACASAEQVEAARRAAHANGAPLRALCYALQFETHGRQWEFIGQWAKLSDPHPSSVLHQGMKWIGPTWAHINDKLVLDLHRSKTEDTTGVRGVFDLSVCPMVMDELARIPLDKRTGPLIVSALTGLPYSVRGFNTAWKKDFTDAGIPNTIWNRDLRASGNTEAGRGGANKEDRAKLAGHSEWMNATVYDRDHLDAHRRVAEAKKIARANTTKTERG